MANQHPIVFVHGLFGFGPGELGPLKYWGKAFQVESPIERRFEASVGPISSAHDRACELAAQIRGTQVDYGEHHARQAGHERFGDDFTGQGFVPDWDRQHPVHLVGHSLGSPTIRCLQHLLEEDFWGWGSNHQWVHSLSTLSGVSNGTSLLYRFGADEKTGLMKRQGIGATMLQLLELYIGATRGLVRLNDIFDFDLDHWGYKREADETMSQYLDRVSESRFLWEKDNAAYSLTMQGAFENNTVWRTFADTYYFSYVTEKTWREPIRGRYLPNPTMNPIMALPSVYIGQKEFSHRPIPFEDFNSSDWWENDGVVPTYSQMFPRTSGRHAVAGEFDDRFPAEQFRPGAWNFNWQRGMDHLDICLTPPLFEPLRQDVFYRNLFIRLAGLPAQ